MVKNLDPGRECKCGTYGSDPPPPLVSEEAYQQKFCVISWCEYFTAKISPYTFVPQTIFGEIKGLSRPFVGERACNSACASRDGERLMVTKNKLRCLY